MKKILVFLCLGFALALAKLINVGSENTYKPFAYLDKKGNAKGFDNELVKIVISYIPDTKANFVSVNWNAISNRQRQG